MTTQSEGDCSSGAESMDTSMDTKTLCSTPIPRYTHPPSDPCHTQSQSQDPDSHSTPNADLHPNPTTLRSKIAACTHEKKHHDALEICASAKQVRNTQCLPQWVGHMPSVVSLGYRYLFDILDQSLKTDLYLSMIGASHFRASSIHDADIDKMLKITSGRQHSSLLLL